MRVSQNCVIEQVANLIWPNPEAEFQLVADPDDAYSLHMRNIETSELKKVTDLQAGHGQYDVVGQTVELLMPLAGEEKGYLSSLSLLSRTLTREVDALLLAAYIANQAT